MPTFAEVAAFVRVQTSYRGPLTEATALQVEGSEVARRVAEAMKATQVISVHADHEWANIYFNGPRFVRGTRSRSR